MERSASIDRTGPLPIVIGATGHIDLFTEDEPRLRQECRLIFESFRHRYPHSPLLLLSPLAEGADTVIANAFMDVVREGDKLVVPLALPEEEFRKDLECDVHDPARPLKSDGDRARCLAMFGRLISLAHRVYVVGTPEQHGEMKSIDASSRRHRSYELVGEEIARESQLLIAIWDGREATTPARAGTAAIIRQQQEGDVWSGDDMTGPLDPIIVGPIYHVAARRRKGNLPAASTEGVRLLLPEGPRRSRSAAAERVDLPAGEDWHSIPAVSGGWRNVLQRIDDFNRDVLELDSHGAPRTSPLPEEITRLVEQSGASDTVALRTWASALASSCQEAVDRRLHWLLGFLLIGGVLWQLYTGPLSYLTVALPSALFIFAAWFLHVRAGKRSLQERYLDYRGLSEGLRVQLAWQLAGVPQSAADYYLSGQRDELAWIRQAIRFTDIGAKAAAGRPKPTLADIEAVVEWWVVGYRVGKGEWKDGQIDYFRKETERAAQKHRRLERFIRWTTRSGAALGIACIAAHAAAGTRSGNGGGFTSILDGPAPAWLSWVFFVTGLVLAVAALAKAYSEYKAFDIRARTYEKAEHLFQLCGERVMQILATALKRATESPNQTVEIPYEQVWSTLGYAGEYALEESGSWIIRHRERGLPAPG